MNTVYSVSDSELRKEIKRLLGDADKETKDYAAMTGRSEESLREEAEGLFLRFQAAVIDPMKQVMEQPSGSEIGESIRRMLRGEKP